MRSALVKGVALIALLLGAAKLSGVLDYATAGANHRHLHSGDKLGYVQNFSIQVYGIGSLSFDEQAGHPADEVGRSIYLPWESDILIKDVRLAPDGSDAWYSVTLYRGEVTEFGIQGWVRASDVKAHHEESITHVQLGSLVPMASEFVR